MNLPERETPSRIVEELELEFDAALRLEDDRSIPASLRGQAAEVELWAALGRHVGALVRVQHGDVTVTGTLRGSHPEHYVVQSEGAVHFIRHAAGPCLLVSRAGRASATPTTHQAPTTAATSGPLAGRQGFLLAVRDLSRRRSPVLLQLLGGRLLSGTIDAVGRDHLELAEHKARDARPRPGQRGIWLVPFAGIAMVSEPRAAV